MSQAHKDEIVEEAIQESKSPRGRHLLLALLILGLGLLVLSGVSGYLLYKQAHASAAKGVDLAQQIEHACRAPGHKAPQIRRICNNAHQVIKSSVAEPGPAGPSGSAGPQGPPPSDAQVALAVANFCQSEGCRGPGPSAGQVAQAVALYCDVRGQCRGPAGSQGLPGQDGSPGPQGDTGTAGPQGPPPTEDQIRDAVTNYCTDHNNCQGPKGDPGPTGVVDVDSSGCQAQDGQVIASVSASYDSDARKIVLTCTYAAPIIPPG